MRSATAVLVAIAVLATAGCKTVRGPNQLWYGGLRVVPASTTLEGDDSGVVYGAGFSTAVYETDQETSHRLRTDLYGAGNREGAAGQLRLEAESGGAPRIDGDHYWSIRGGLATELERNPYNGWMVLELPVVTTGYQYHPSGTDLPIHLEVGPRVAFAAVGRASTERNHTRVIAAPDVGAAAAALFPGFAMELGYSRFFERGSPVDLGRGLACAAFGFAACADLRLLRGEFGPTNTRATTTFVGITIGIGISRGVEHRRLF